MSQITSHVLDTSTGKPATEIRVVLFEGDNNDWLELSSSVTNKEGRVTTLLPDDTILQAGLYKLKFFTKEYFQLQSLTTLYPYVDLVFEITGPEHYHVPLLLSPYGYSTYRGS